MKNNLKQHLFSSVSPDALLKADGVDVCLAPIHKEQESALATYLRNKGQEEVDFQKPFSNEVIDFIVDSLNFDVGIHPIFKEKLKEGFSCLNQKSETGRFLLAQLPKNVGVHLLSDEVGNSSFFVVPGQNDVFIHKEHLDSLTPERFALEFLHEMGHLNEYQKIRPLEDFSLGFVDKDGKAINSSIENEFSSSERYRSNLLLEAEKQALTYQILSETMSVKDKVICGAMAVLGGAAEGIIGLFPGKETKPAMDQLGFFQYLNVKKNKLKNFLKHPTKLFSNKGRKEIALLSKKEAIGDFVSYLVLKPKKNMLKAHRWWGVPTLFAGSVFLGAGGLAALAGGYLMGSGLFFLKEKKAAFRKRWQNTYQQFELNNLLGYGLVENSKSQQFDRFLNAMNAKYAGALNQNKMKEMPLDEEGMALLFESKKQYLSFSDGAKNDLKVLMQVIAPEMKVDEKEGDSQIQMISFISEFLNEEQEDAPLLNKKEKSSFETRFLDWVSQLLEEEKEDFLPNIKEDVFNLISTVQHPKLRRTLFSLREEKKKINENKKAFYLKNKQTIARE